MRAAFANALWALDGPAAAERFLWSVLIPSMNLSQGAARLQQTRRRYRSSPVALKGAPQQWLLRRI